MWTEKQKEGLLALFVANVGLLVCLFTLGDWGQEGQILIITKNWLGVRVLIRTSAEYVNIAVMDNLNIFNNVIDDVLY